MTKKIAALVAALVLVLISAAACAANEDRGLVQSSSVSENQSITQSSQQTSTGTGEQGNGAGEPEVIQKQIERETQKMKEEGVVDKNGRPAPGVDLNDYPGLG
ncbi:hypothetical protein [Acutalibacter intestini]|uniref:hypothetical protein n=1 Tax=Acutalibacter intestini TaxID=3093659 RepID=UPI002AC9EBA8|nr:hypothetical protein [Acutalibacter sp. M00204]